MEGEFSLTPEQLEAMTPEQILAYLDATWPWPLSEVQGWFEDLWNSILAWLHQVVGWVWNKIASMKSTIVSWFTDIKDWIVEKVTPIVAKVYDWLKSVRDWLWDKIDDAFDNVYDWLKSARDWLWDKIEPLLDDIWSGLQNIARTVAAKVTEIKDWFSNEFMDPFIDWLVQLPGKLWDRWVESMKVVWELFTKPIREGWQLVVNAFNFYKDWTIKVFTPGTFEREVAIKGLAALGAAILIAVGVYFAAPIIAAVMWAGRTIIAFAPTLGNWFLTIFTKLFGWLGRLGALIAPLILTMLKGIAGKLVAAWIPLITSGAVLALSATGELEKLVDRFVTPAITDVFDWFESMGPTAPESGVNLSKGITKIATFTISGLAAMTLGGELLSPLKQLGLGNISAIIFDLINYKTLTAAFMGVLAFVYIKQPLTYYYQRAARPNLPDERQTMQLAGEYAITRSEFNDLMAWHGYPDKWHDKLYELADRPMTPYMLRSLAQAGILDEEFLDRELHNAGYNEKSIPYLKLMFTKLASGELKALMTSSALSRYKEGLDDAGNLQHNLIVLGVDPALMPQYLFAANLNYLTDYQTDIIAYYKDAYHRREIDESGLRMGLASAGLLNERIDLAVERERIKRLKPASPTAPEVSSVKVDTIRRKRRKDLLTRGQEIDELIAIGVATPDAITFADNDDVRMAGKAEET